MSEEYKMQRIKEYLIFHIKNSKEQRELLDYLDQLQQKENIIKEVREKIKEFCWDYEYETYSNMTSDEVKELAELLNKEVN